MTIFMWFCIVTRNLYSPHTSYSFLKEMIVNKRVVFLLCVIFLLFHQVTFSQVTFPADKKQQNGVLVTVNGKKITYDDIASRLAYFKDSNPENLKVIKQEIIDQLITDILVDEFIDKQGLVVAPEEVDREVEQIRNNIMNSQQNVTLPLEQILASAGLNINELKKSIKHSIALERYFSNKLDEKMLKKYFEENKNIFNGESVKVSHILIDTRNMKTQDEISKALEQIKTIKREVDRGTSFEEAAKKYSNHPSAEDGGDLGYIQRKGILAKAFLDTAFSLRIGEVSDPVQTEYGYHLIKVTDKKEGANLQFAEVKEKVRSEVLDVEIIKLIDRLHKEARIVTDQ